MAGRWHTLGVGLASSMLAMSLVVLPRGSPSSLAEGGGASPAIGASPSVAPSVGPSASPATASYAVRDCRTPARIWRGDEPPSNDDATGDLTGTQGARLRTGDELTVEVPPVPGGSYDSGCSGVSDYRWYRLRERNGAPARGWVSAQAIASGPSAASTDPGFPAWGEPSSISEHRVDDVAIDSDGSLHTVTETDAGIVYSTDRDGTWTSETIHESGSREPGSGGRFAVSPRIAVDDGLVAIVFGDRGAQPGPGDCAPGPCWELLGSTVMAGTAGGWTSVTFDDLTTVPESADATADIAVRGDDIYVSDGRRLALRTDGRWSEESVPLSYRRTAQWGDTNAALAVDDSGIVHVAAMDYLGREIGYARQDESGWTPSTVASGRGVLSGIAALAGGNALIGYSRAKERYPGELCSGDCAVPSTYHLVTLDGAAPVDAVVPGDGWGVLGMDASDAPMVTRWSENGIAWRRALGGVWQTTSWAVPPWNGSFSSHEEVGGVKPHGLWVLGGDGVVAVVYEPKGGGTRSVRAVDAPRPGT